MFSNRNNEREGSFSTLAHSFFQSYRGVADLYHVQDNRKSLIAKKCILSFVSEEEDYDFFVIVERANSKPYRFKITGETILTNEFIDCQIVAFQFSLDDSDDCLARVDLL